MRGHPGTGNLTYVSAIDGVRRLGSYQHLSEYPLVTLVSQSEWDLQSSWRDELRSHAIIMLCVGIVLVVLGRRAVKANHVLNAQAMQDGLTGLANRRFFDETIEREFRRAERSGQSISIIMIDIDRFKNYNDCYGHPAGDECLRTMASTIQGCLRRAGDFAARYGGEEIVVVLPGLGTSSANALAETMRQAVHDLALPHAHSLHGIVTFSAGVATYAPGQRNSGSWRTLVEDADVALYRAKAKGRDTVERWSPPVVSIRTVPAQISVVR
jgi:diguanylate cyclase (GGDEF)-like protein